jgi:hypothetical protein
VFAAGGIGARRRTASHLGPTAFIRGLEINSVHNAFLQIEVKSVAARRETPLQNI